MALSQRYPGEEGYQVGFMEEASRKSEGMESGTTNYNDASAAKSIRESEGTTIPGGQGLCIQGWRRGSEPGRQGDPISHCF